MFSNLFQKQKNYALFKISTVFIAVLTSFSVQSIEISCNHIQMIKKEFLKHHVLYTNLADDLKQKTVNNFIKHLDREKIYFLKSDVKKIKLGYQKLFKNIKANNCKELYKIYSIYAKRTKERNDFAIQYINNNFAFDKKLTYILDDKLKKHPINTAEANKKMKAYIQYQLANIFLLEKNLSKTIRQFTFFLNNLNKQIKSWKPVLNSRELRKCKNKSKNSFKACKPSNWLTGYLNSFSKALDSHSSFMDAKDMEEFNISMNLELEGIGATLSSRFGYTVVEKLVSGGAAEKSKKIQVKDKILAVGQTPKKFINIFGERIEDVVSIIRGPKGTAVYLKILRKQKKEPNKTFTVKLIRSYIELKEERASLSYHDIKDGKKTYKVALVQVPSFYGSSFFGKSVTRDVKKLLSDAHKEKVDSLVLDLSYNRGGSLEEAVHLSGLFFSTGNVVKQSERNRQNNFKSYIFKDKDARISYSKPLVILVNRFSASASEIVSGALQDYKRAVIVGGDHTFGKGSVQSVQSIGDLGALRTTIGLYFIPSGRSTQNTGVTSDISFPSIFNIDAIGEKNLEDALPSKSIANFKSKPREIFSKTKEMNWQVVSSQTIAQLKKSSIKRIKQNKDFQKLQKKMQELQAKAKKQKTITIAEVLEDENNNNIKSKSETEDPLIDTAETDKKNYFERPDIKNP